MCSMGCVIRTPREVHKELVVHTRLVTLTVTPVAKPPLQTQQKYMIYQWAAK